jgi:predicted small secreted protein
MKRDGFKRAVVLGMVASALMLAGCRNERGGQGIQGQQQPVREPGTGGAGQEQGENEGREPEDLRQEPEEEGFQSVPEEQEAPSGIGLDGRGGSEPRRQDDQH